MIKRGNWAPDTLNTGLRDRVMDEAARFVCVLYYRGRLGTTVNYKFIVFSKAVLIPCPCRAIPSTPHLGTPDC